MQTESLFGSLEVTKEEVLDFPGLTEAFRDWILSLPSLRKPQLLVLALVWSGAASSKGAAIEFLNTMSKEAEGGSLPMTAADLGGEIEYASMETV